MKIHSLKLTNYKKFLNNELVFERPFTVLIGKNNSGKSTILLALADLLGVNVPLIHPFLNKKLGSTGTAKREIHLKLTKDEWRKVIQLQQHDYQDTPDYGEILPKLEECLLSFTMSSPYVDGLQPQGNIPKFTLTGKYPLDTFTNSAQQIISIAINRLNAPTLRTIGGVSFVSADRTSQNRETFIPFDNYKTKENAYQFIRNGLYLLKKKKLEDFKLIMEKIKAIFPDVDKFDVVNNEDTGFVDVQLTENAIEMDIEEMGGGTKSLLLTLAQILSPNTTIALLDEPDINMHPGLVKDFAGFLEEISINKQIIITSHHETFVNEIDVENILHIYSAGELCSQITPLEKNEGILKVLDDLGGGHESNFLKSQILTAKVVVFTEGPTDWIYIQKFASKLSLSDKFTQLDPQPYSLGGRKKIDANMLDELNGSRKPFVVILDRDESIEEANDQLKKKYGEDRIHIHNKRELENYMLEYETMLKVIKKKSENKSEEIKSKIAELDPNKFKNKIFKISAPLSKKVILLRFIQRLPFLNLLSYNEMSKFVETNFPKDSTDIINALRSNILEKITPLTVDILKEIMEKEEQFTNEHWNIDEILDICPGKDLLNLINIWLSENFEINISFLDLLKETETVHPDIEKLIHKIINAENNTS